ncbi:hypothetical protein ASD38_10980 [Caulobacter sp. Root487D2Y]|uniref:hypothetical protein n=1 Tax=Caulobacter sp. Root487D2Y TaxID=1736547 RepID=UPI0006F1DB5F|nr:hypothetical protein [Caulobacter sp. Root487D2Y]KQY29834.1 hypothetical protein ASD38_10980 [Caulobacter sp. Root487D2Y]
MRSLVLFAVVVPLLAACASKSEPPPQKIQTTSDANKEGISGAAGAPLRDMNLLRTKIPAVLLEAMADPYARPPGKKISCETLIMMVAPLDLALGEDVDRRPPEDNEDLLDRGKRMAGSAAFGAMASAAQDLIPMRGWVRKLSGAEKHDKLVQHAMASGAIRRAYLKGLGEARGCNPPATPQHLAKPAAPIVEKRFPWEKDQPAEETPAVQSSEVDATPVDAAPAQPTSTAKKKKKPIYKIW